MRQPTPRVVRSNRPRGSDPAGGQAPTLERVGQLEEVRGDWDELAAGAGHPFGTWEWVSAWWRYYGDDLELYTWILRASTGKALALLPMYVAKRRPVRIARFLGYGDLQSPLCAARHRVEAAAALGRVIGRGRERCRLLVAERTPGDQRWGPLLGGRHVKSDPGPALPTEGRTWQEYLATRSTSFRKTVRYRARRLARQHTLSIDLCSSASELDNDFDDLVRLHRLRWQAETSGIFEGKRGRMQREIAAAMLERGWLRLRIARLDGVPAAAYYGLRYANSEWFLQSGRDPRFEKLSIGSVLLAHAIECAFDEGVDSFRFLAGNESYKARYASDDIPAETLLVGSGPLAAGAAIAARSAVSYRAIR